MRFLCARPIFQKLRDLKPPAGRYYQTVYRTDYQIDLPAGLLTYLPAGFRTDIPAGFLNRLLTAYGGGRLDRQKPTCLKKFLAVLFSQLAYYVVGIDKFFDRAVLLHEVRGAAHPPFAF